MRLTKRLAGPEGEKDLALAWVLFLCVVVVKTGLRWIS